MRNGSRRSSDFSPKNNLSALKNKVLPWTLPAPPLFFPASAVVSATSAHKTHATALYRLPQRLFFKNLFTIFGVYPCFGFYRSETMRRTYASDVSRERFEKIRPLLETAREKTKPREVDLYEVFCAILYLLKSGCQWRMLPSDFPKW